MSLENFLQNNRLAFDSEIPSSGVWDNIRQELDAEAADGLLRFVNENRLAFDKQAPPAVLFDRIQSSAEKPLSVNKRPSSYLRSWWLQAAAVLVLIGAGLWAGRMQGYQDARNDYMAVISQIQPDFPEAEAYYQQNIAEISAVVHRQNRDPRLVTDLAEMDRAIEELRQELLQVPRQQQAMILADLIKTYRIKLQILQSILASLPEETEADDKTQQYENNEI